MSILARSISMIAAYLIGLTTWAGEGDVLGTVRKLPDEPYGGMVVNQTITVVGRDFYKYFAEAWMELPLTERYVISVQEWPSARWGSRIWVQYAQRSVYQVFLSPARIDVKAAAQQASEIAYRNTVDADIQRLFFRDPDLGFDEI